jgi:hypothetical protein
MSIPSDEPNAPHGAGGTADGFIYFLWAGMLLDGIMRVIVKDDVPFGVVQIATALAGAGLRLLRERRTATWVVIVALATVIVASAIAEMNVGHSVEGVAILALAALLVYVRQRRTKTKQLAP